jgi:DnaJ-domain-containing protein 1
MTQPDAGERYRELTAEEREPDQVIKLIRKLRWIGLETEAKELQEALEGIPSPHRGSLVAGPHSTD